MGKLRVFTAFSGYDSQCMALDLLGIDYELVGWCDIDANAIKAHDSVYPQYASRNYGDISKIDWDQAPDFDLFTYSSPCFVAGTLVLTNRGYIPIEDVQCGDMVLGHDSAFHKVSAVGYREVDHHYHLRGMMFDFIDCSANHPFYVRHMRRSGHFSVRTFSDPEWVEAKDLKRGDYVGYAINTESVLPAWCGVEDNRWGHHRVQDHISDRLQSHKFWYLMGRYLGDGWCHGKNKSQSRGIVVCCSSRNVDSLLSCITDLGYRFRCVDTRTVIKIFIYSKELFSFVQRFGYYSYGKFIDFETLCLPTHLLSALIDGVIDSDGNIKPNGEYRVTSVSRALLYGLSQCISKVYHCPVKMYASSRPPTTVIEGRVVNQRSAYTIVWHTDHRSHDHAFYEDGIVWFPLREVSLVSSGVRVYNIQVDDSHTYTANGVIVHNCQDYSFAGLQMGGEEGSGTRSSLLWECRKAIVAKRPKFLLMENVKALVGQKFYKTYQKWDNFLMRSGYRTYSQVLNAKDYGVPQNRERIFNISILDDGQSSFYSFPPSFPLTRCLSDLLEAGVPESYYLSGEKVRNIFSWLAIGDGLLPILHRVAVSGGIVDAGGRSTGRMEGNPKERQSRGSGTKVQMLELNQDSAVSNTLTSVQKDNYVLQVAQMEDDTDRAFQNPQVGRVYSPDGCAPTLNTMQGGGREPKVIVVGNYKPCDGSILPTSLESHIMATQRTDYGKRMRRAYESGEFKASRHDFTEMAPRMDGVSNTLTSVQKDNYLFTPLYLGEFRGMETEVCVVEDFRDELVLAARFGDDVWHLFWIRVRKLTPRECFRLMGVREGNIDKIMGSGVARSKLYGLAGNSIVVDVLVYMFAELFHYNEIGGEFIFDRDKWVLKE